MSFSCPLCHQPLSREKNSYICPQRHQFDMAKEGYVNLLPVQHKRSRDPGDSAEMMQARRAFLDAGHYQPLRDAIVAQLRERLDDKATAVLDIGCGEGYYTHAFADALPEITTFGLDVSKVAIKAAAKRYPQVTFCVASSHRLPGVRSQKSGKHWQQKKCSTARRTLIFTSGSVLINRGSASRGSGRRCRSVPARREFPLFSQ